MTPSKCATCFIGHYGDLNCMYCENTPISFTLPFPPSVNHYWRHRVVRNRPAVYISPQGNSFRKQVCLILAQKCLSLGLNDPVVVDITLRPPNRVRRDLDNYAGKALLDALTHAGLWTDDSLVHELHMRWGTVIKGGETIVTVRPM